MTTFESRAELVADNLNDLNLGRIIPPALDDLRAADERVAGQVQAVRDADKTPRTDEQFADLAGQIVSGKIKADTAIRRIAGAAGAKYMPGQPRRSRLDRLAAAVETAARAAEDRAEFSPAALRRSVVPEVRARLQAVADDMLSTMKAAPAIVRDKLAEVYSGSGYVTRYGQPSGMSGAMEWIAPGNDFRSVRPDHLQAVQELQASWSVLSPSSFDPLFWLGTGQVAQRNSMNEYTGGAAGAFEHFDPSLLLVGGDGIDYIAAGLRLDFLVAAGIVDDFDVLANPFDEDAEAYGDRVQRAAQFDMYINEKRHLRAIENGAVLVRDQEHHQDMQRRTEATQLDQVELFRRELLGSGRSNG